MLPALCFRSASSHATRSFAGRSRSLTHPSDTIEQLDIQDGQASEQLETVLRRFPELLKE